MKKKLCVVVIILLAAFYAPAEAAKVSKTATVTAENTFTTPAAFVGVFNVSIIGASFVGTVTLQRSFDKGFTWGDVDTWVSADTEEWKFEPEGDVLYRLGCKTSGFTSGSVAVRLSQ
jgi:hypothetical protein